MMEYEMIIEGHLGIRWMSLFPNMKITNLENGTTRVAGPVRDQSELHALILSIQDLGMSLIKVEKIQPADI